MHDALRHREALLRDQFHRPTLEINEKFSLHDVEELIFVVVLMPVEFALNHPEPND